MEAVCNNNIVDSYVDFYQTTQGQKFIFSYRGILSHAIIKNLLSITEKKISQLQEEENIRRKIFGVMVNCLQTVCADDESPQSQPSIFMISKDDEGFALLAGRYFSNEMVETMINAIDTINRQTSHADVVDLHKEKLVEMSSLGDLPSVDETILSLIDIARKTHQKINYQADQRQSGDSFFSIQVHIS